MTNKKLYYLRKASGKSQSFIAKKAGLSKATISNFELHTEKLKPSTAKRVEEVYNKYVCGRKTEKYFKLKILALGMELNEAKYWNHKKEIMKEIVETVEMIG